MSTERDQLLAWLGGVVSAMHANGDTRVGAVEDVAEAIAAGEHLAIDGVDRVAAAIQQERAAVVRYLRTTPRAMGRPLYVDSSQPIAWLAEDIANGEHVKEQP